MSKYYDEIEEAPLQEVLSRDDPTPLPYTLHTRREVGTGKIVRRLKLYMNGDIEEVPHEPNI